MHAGSSRRPGTRKPPELTDSLRMFQAGVERGRPAPGEVGVAPEWFYKGVGTMLRGHDDALVVPRFAEGGGEEAEIAGVYVIGRRRHARAGSGWRPATSSPITASSGATT